MGWCGAGSSCAIFGRGGTGGWLFISRRFCALRWCGGGGGWEVWRSTSLDGSYVQVNEALIPSASPGGTSGGSYVFTDQSAVSGTNYYYKLQELEVNGALNWYGPVSTAGNAPTAVTLADAGTALAWWPLAAGAAAAAAAGLGFAWSRRRRS